MIIYGMLFIQSSAFSTHHRRGEVTKRDNKMGFLCPVVERSFPSTYRSVLSWVAKNGVLILTEIDRQHEYTACLTSLLDAQQKAQQTLNNGIVC